MRRKVIAGNWKMNMLPADTINFIEGLAPLVKDSENEVILCVPYTDLFYAWHTTEGTNIHALGRKGGIYRRSFWTNAKEHRS